MYSTVLQCKAHIQNVSAQNVSSTKRLVKERLRNKTSPKQNVSITKRLLIRNARIDNWEIKKPSSLYKNPPDLL
jgi:hypothetical protein